MLTLSSAIQPANTTAVLVGAGAGTILRKIEASNNAATAAYLKLYNSPPGTAPTASDTPVLRLMIPAGNLIEVSYESLGFTQGCWYRVTRNLVDTDATAVVANEVVINIYR
jgi:hypothetical protein